MLGTRRACPALLPLAIALALLACEEPAPRRDPALRTERHVSVEESSADEPPLAEEALPPPIADESPTAAGDHAERTLLPAAAIDTAYDSDEEVDARRFVYRVHLEVPAVLGEPGGEVETAAAELIIDVSAERLRARFGGPGWPALGEVRLRGDSPGGYLFDAHGGRPLLPGELAAWFEGGPPRAGPILMVRRDPALRGGVDPGPGMLLCALLSEWAGEPRDNVMRRCSVGAPLSFRVGWWQGERMADVNLRLPRRELRADQEVPPTAEGYRTSGTFLEPAAVGRLAPHTRSSLEPSDDGLGPMPTDGFEMVNRSDARILVITDGVAIGWVDAESTGAFRGLTPGVHDVAAMRPLGAAVMRTRDVLVPGRTILRATYRAIPE